MDWFITSWIIGIGDSWFRLGECGTGIRMGPSVWNPNIVGDGVGVGRRGGRLVGFGE